MGDDNPTHGAASTSHPSTETWDSPIISPLSTERTASTFGCVGNTTRTAVSETETLGSMRWR